MKLIVAGALVLGLATPIIAAAQTNPPPAPVPVAPREAPPARTGDGTNTPAVATPNTTNPTAPVPGANSFTEGQAKSRIESNGFSEVTGLQLDSQGIWRGKAKKDGKMADVALDYQGNVSAK